MGMLGKDKRKGKVTSQSEAVNSNIVPMDVDTLVINTPMQNCYFKRLKYKGCPTVNGGNVRPGSFKKDEVLIDMKRDALVREVFNVLRRIETESTILSYFSNIISYLRVLDSFGKTADFSEKNILLYHAHLHSDAKKGIICLSTVRKRMRGVIRFLNETNQKGIVRKIPTVEGNGLAEIPYKVLSDAEIKPVAKKLLDAFNVLANHFISGTVPIIHPFFDEDALKKLGYTEDKIKLIKQGCIHSMKIGYWENNLIRCAIMITFMLTGINPTPLYNMKRKNVKFKKGTADSYTFESIKGRAGYQQQTNDIGFTKRGKEFIERWQVVSDRLSKGDGNAFLFPYIKTDGTLKSWVGLKPQNQINNALKPYRLACISASRFRKTRSNILMRVMNDALEVATANNNSVITTEKSYLHGVEEDNDRQLAAAFKAQEMIARGEDKKIAIKTVAYDFKDPLSEFDYKKLKKGRLPNITLTGVRCENPFGGKAKASIQKFKKEGLGLNDSIKACTDFLGCFGCSDHALIAEEDDIWLMLSFRDTVKESLSRTSINSQPSDKFYKILNTIDAIIKRFKEVAPDEYSQAIEKNNIESHPLYSDEHSIKDLEGVYA